MSLLQTMVHGVIPIYCLLPVQRFRIYGCMQDGDQWPFAYANSYSGLNCNCDCKLKDWLARWPDLMRLNHVCRLKSGYISGLEVTT